MDLVIDTCVIVAAFNKSEPHHKESADFIEEAKRRRDQLLVPTTLLWELGATLIRQQMTRNIQANPESEVNFIYITITWELWAETWKEDKMINITGSDRIFISIALKYDAPLVTWDTKLLERACTFGIETITPADYLGCAIN